MINIIMEKLNFFKKYILNIIFLGFVFFYKGLAYSEANSHPIPNQNSLCVLNFNPKNHFFSKYIEKLFEGSQNTKIISSALPKDILNCVKTGAEEIIITTHSRELINNSDLSSLIFYLSFSVEEQKQKIRESKESIDRQLEERYDWEFRNGLIDINQLDYFSLEMKEKAEKINRLIKKYEKIKNIEDREITLYEPYEFDSHIFHLIAEELKSEKEKSGSIKLTKIRLMTCHPQKVFARYPILKQISQDFEIEIDIPMNKGFFKYFYKIMTKNKDVKYIFNDDWYLESYQN